jgi:amidohydrolase
MSSILQKMETFLSWSVQHRRHLHQFPELSCQEQETSQYCAKILAELGYTITPSWGFGFTADLIAKTASKKKIAIRADMDALPIQEKNTHDFVSTHAGKMHACGHDGHMTVALTAARFLAEYPQSLPCNVRFIFQPSEERAPGGAPGMIEKGCLEGVDEVYGLHNDPGTPVGKIRTRVGALMAAADLFELTIHGKGCHAARPHDGLDPVIMGAKLITEWQSIVTRRINPVHPAVLSVTQFKAGDIFNVIPDTAYLAGTIRTFDKGDRALIRELMQISLVSAEQQGYGMEFNYIEGYDPVINQKPGVERIARAAREVVGIENVDTATDPEGWAEDFCYYLQHRPGGFYFLGSGNAQKNIVAPLHSARYDFDEYAIAIGAAIMSTIILQS